MKGCAGGAIALTDAFARSIAYKHNVLVVTVDVHSFYMIHDDYSDPARALELTLFGDGASACIVSNTGLALWTVDPNHIASHTFYDLTCNMQILFMERSMSAVLDRNVHNIMSLASAEVLNDLCSKSGVKKEEINNYLLHPGGKSILETITKDLNITAPYSYETLSRYGNMSCATILFVLAQSLESKTTGYDVCICFGQGVHACGFLLNRQ